MKKKVIISFFACSFIIFGANAQKTLESKNSIKSVEAKKIDPQIIKKGLSLSTEKNIMESNIAMDNIDGFMETPNGLLYKFERKSKSDKVAKVGDLAMLHVEFWMGDSLMFNTKRINANQTVPEFIKDPKHRGDVYEGIAMMKPGEVAIFKTTLAEMAANTNTTIPPTIKNGKYATWRIEMVDLKTKKDIQEEEGKLAKEDEKQILEYLKRNKLKGEKLNEGVYIVTHEQGSGNHPEKGDKVTVNYTGKLLNGTVFDSNVDPKFNHVSPFSFAVGTSSVIKGWDAALLQMKKGQKVTVLIPSALAYGKNSPSPDIPANSIMIFDIDLLEIAKP